MRLIPGLAVLFSSIVTFPLGAHHDPPREQEDTGAVARSGDVEINGIYIHRRKASYAAKEADLVYMTLSLWLPVGGKGPEFRREGYSVRVTELQPIEDNTGKILTTKSRLNDIRALSEEVPAGSIAARVGRQGPVLEFQLDAPARGASALKLVKGKVEVRRSMKGDILKFDDLAARVGKPLDHPKLKDFPITPSIKFRVGTTRVTLRLPKEHVRLLGWKVMYRGRELPALSIGESPDKDGVELSQGYRGDFRENVSELELAAPVEATTMPFEFKDLELP